MIVDVDVGNTRIKWRCTYGANGEQPVFGSCGSHDENESLCQLQALFDDHLNDGQARLRLAAVANGSLVEKLSHWAHGNGIAVQIAETSAHAGGVSCGYSDVASLGVDRWLAAIAAYHHVGKSPVVVVDAGSALTVDVVVDGQHLGGYIVPGVSLMRRSLAVGTSQVKVSAKEDLNDLTLGINTQDAVCHGTLLMILSMIKQVTRDTRATVGGDVELLLTGGDAPLLCQSLPNAKLYDHLVLDGLEILFP